MPRTFGRSLVLKALYEWEMKDRKGDPFDFLLRNFEYFREEEKISLSKNDLSFCENILKYVLDNLQKIDEIIKESSKQYKFETIDLIEKNILRISAAEILKGLEDKGYKKEVPEKVAINEAVEMSKTFCEEEGVKFINGVLGTIYENLTAKEKNA